MDSNTHSTQPPGQQPGGPPPRLASLTAAVEELAAQDLDRLADAALAAQVLELRRLLDRLEGHWLNELAGVDARGAAGAEAGQQVGSTAAWLRNRLRLGAGTASSAVRTARALFRGPVDRHRPGPDQRGAVGRPRPGGRLWHPPPARPGDHPGRGGPGRGGPAAGPTPAPAAPGPPAPARPPRRHRPGPRTPPCPPGACGWPRPLRAWSRWMGCWNPRPAR